MKSLRLLPAIVWTLFILTLTLLPSSDIPQIPNSFLKYFKDFDKLVHCGIFTVFVFLWALTIRRRNVFSQLALLVFILLIAIGLGLGIEYLQKLFVRLDRSFEWKDWIADTSGALLGALLYCCLLVVNWLKKFEQPERGISAV